MANVEKIKDDVFANDALCLLLKKKKRRQAALAIRNYSGQNFKDLTEFHNLEKKRDQIVEEIKKLQPSQIVQEFMEVVKGD